MDSRTTAEVEATRNYSNRKPYRTQRQREIARDLAVKHNGTFISRAPVIYHPSVV